MEKTGTIDKSIQMNKATPQWQTFLQILGMIGALIAFSMNQSERFAKVEERLNNEKNRNDERYIEQRESNRELKSLMQDIKAEQYNQRILIENKANRK